MQSLKLNINDLSNKTNIDITTLNQIINEDENLSAIELSQITRALNCSEYYLLTGNLDPLSIIFNLHEEAQKSDIKILENIQLAYQQSIQ